MPEAAEKQNVKKEKLLTANFMILFAATYLMFFAMDFFIPVLPFYVVDAGGRETAVGLLMGLFTFSSVVLRPFQGRRLNLTGRKKLLLLGIGVYAVGGLGLLALPSITFLYLIRALQGFGWGAFLLAFNTMTIDLAPPGRKGEAVGIMGIAPPLSLATAPFLAELISKTLEGYIPLFLISIVMALTSLALTFAIKEPPLEQDENLITALFSRKVLLPSVMIFFITFSFGGILTFLPLLGEARNIVSVGAFFTVFAITTMLVRPVTGYLSDRRGRHVVFLPGILLIFLAMVAVAFAENLNLLLLSGFLYGCGMGSAHPAVLALAADKLSAGDRGVGMATFTAAFDLGIVAGAVILGILLTYLNFYQLFMLCALSALVPLSVYIVYRIKRAG